MKKLLLLALCLGVLAGRARAQTAPAADLVVVRLLNNKALVVRGEGKTEQVELGSGIGMKAFITESESYHKLFSQLYQEGYTLQNSFSTGTGVAVTLLFVRKPKP